MHADLYSVLEHLSYGHHAHASVNRLRLQVSHKKLCVIRKPSNSVAFLSCAQNRRAAEIEECYGVVKCIIFAVPSLDHSLSSLNPELDDYCSTLTNPVTASSEAVVVIIIGMAGAVPIAVVAEQHKQSASAAVAAAAAERTYWTSSSTDYIKS